LSKVAHLSTELCFDFEAKTGVLGNMVLEKQMTGKIWNMQPMEPEQLNQ
jgi:hypothetical protein